MAYAKSRQRIVTAQRGVDFAEVYADACGHAALTRARKAKGTARAARATLGASAAALRGPFLAPGALSRGERLRTLAGIETVIDGLYAHLPLKRARYAFDPVQRLRVLRAQVDALSDQDFHTELAATLARLRDAHTCYMGPKVFEDVVAVLPFMVEMYGPEDDLSYLVTKVAATTLDEAFAPGALVQSWNGVPIDVAVRRWGEHASGGRPDSQRVTALEYLTFRPLQFFPPPDEHWVVVGFRKADRQGLPTGPLREVRVAWRIVNPNVLASAPRQDRGRRAAVQPARRLSMRRAVNPAAAAVRQAKMLLYAPHALSSGSRARLRRSGLDSALPDTFEARTIDTPDGPVGYLRIWAFDKAEPEAHVAELLRLLPLLPQDGLIVDIRANPGGYIEAAERSLQLFTPHPIVPTRFSALATEFTRALAETPGLGQEELAPWRDSLEAAVRNGELYSRALPIADPAACNAIGQVYGGPVLLVGDASTYSSGDLFAAGFVDNGIGPFVCVGAATGAGGANVSDYASLRQALHGTRHAMPALAEGIDLSFSFRRATRSGPSEGLPIEDVGVAGDLRYHMTRRDVLERNVDLIDYCIERLRRMPLTRLAATLRADRRSLGLASTGLDRIDVAVDGAPLHSGRPPGQQVQRLALPPGAGLVEVRGFRRGVLAQRRLIPLG